MLPKTWERLSVGLILVISSLLFTIFIGERFGGGNPEVLKGLVEAKMMGRKSDKGLFTYAKGSKERPVNQDGMNIIKKFATVAPAATAGDDDIVLRMVTRFHN